MHFRTKTCSFHVNLCAATVSKIERSKKNRSLVQNLSVWIHLRSQRVSTTNSENTHFLSTLYSQCTVQCNQAIQVKN